MKRMSPKEERGKRDLESYKVERAMKERNAGELHSGSKHGPLVRSRKQAIAIGLNEARRLSKKRRGK